MSESFGDNGNVGHDDLYCFESCVSGDDVNNDIDGIDDVGDVDVGA